MIEKLLQYLRDKWRGIPLGGARRSNEWPKIRKQYIKKECEFCGKKRGLLKSLELHHIFPVNIAPSEELNPNNFFTACRTCHFEHCHLGSFFSYDVDIRAEAERYKNKVANRP